MMLTKVFLYGILGYLSLVNPSYAIFNCRTPEEIKGVARDREYVLVDEDFFIQNPKPGQVAEPQGPAGYQIEFDLNDGRHVFVYFNRPRKDRPELLCMYREEIIKYEMGGIRL